MAGEWRGACTMIEISPAVTYFMESEREVKEAASSE